MSDNKLRYLEIDSGTTGSIQEAEFEVLAENVIFQETEDGETTETSLTDKMELLAQYKALTDQLTRTGIKIDNNVYRLVIPSGNGEPYFTLSLNDDYVTKSIYNKHIDFSSTQEELGHVKVYDSEHFNIDNFNVSEDNEYVLSAYSVQEVCKKILSMIKDISDDEKSLLSEEGIHGLRYYPQDGIDYLWVKDEFGTWHSISFSGKDEIIDRPTGSENTGSKYATINFLLGKNLTSDNGLYGGGTWDLHKIVDKKLTFISQGAIEKTENKLTTTISITDLKAGAYSLILRPSTSNSNLNFFLPYYFEITESDYGNDENIVITDEYVSLDLSILSEDKKDTNKNLNGNKVQLWYRKDGDTGDFILLDDKTSIVNQGYMVSAIQNGTYKVKFNSYVSADKTSLKQFDENTPCYLLYFYDNSDNIEVEDQNSSYFKESLDIQKIVYSSPFGMVKRTCTPVQKVVSITNPSTRSYIVLTISSLGENNFGYYEDDSKDISIFKIACPPGETIKYINPYDVAYLVSGMDETGSVTDPIGSVGSGSDKDKDDDPDDGKIGLETIPKFSYNNIQEVTQVVEGYYKGIYSLDDIQKVWKVGDSLEFELGAITLTDRHYYKGWDSLNYDNDVRDWSRGGGTVKMTIIAFDSDHDPIYLNSSLNTANRKNALITLQSEYLLNIPQVDVGDYAYRGKNNNGYLNSIKTGGISGGDFNIDKFLTKIYNALPKDIKVLVKKVNKTFYCTKESSDIYARRHSTQVFLPSPQEIWADAQSTFNQYGPEKKIGVYDAYAGNKKTKYLWKTDKDGKIMNNLLKYRKGDKFYDVGVGTNDKAPNWLLRGSPQDGLTQAQLKAKDPSYQGQYARSYFYVDGETMSEKSPIYANHCALCSYFENKLFIAPCICF